MTLRTLPASLSGVPPKRRKDVRNRGLNGERGFAVILWGYIYIDRSERSARFKLAGSGALRTALWGRGSGKCIH